MTKTYIRKLSNATFYFKDEVSLINHREDGPAIEYVNGTKHWYVNGKLHRLDGPASEYCYGSKEWYLDGKEYSEEEHKRLVKMIAFL